MLNNLHIDNTNFIKVINNIKTLKYLYNKPCCNSENWISIDDVNNYFNN